MYILSPDTSDPTSKITVEEFGFPKCSFLIPVIWLASNPWREEKMRFYWATAMSYYSHAWHMWHICNGKISNHYMTSITTQ